MSAKFWLDPVVSLADNYGYSRKELRDIEQIAGAGFGLHWPDLDEDIGVEGLLLGKKSAESSESFERWLQRRK